MSLVGRRGTEGRKNEARRDIDDRVWTYIVMDGRGNFPKCMYAEVRHGGRRMRGDGHGYVWISVAGRRGTEGHSNEVQRCTDGHVWACTGARRGKQNDGRKRGTHN